MGPGYCSYWIFKNEAKIFRFYSRLDFARWPRSGGSLPALEILEQRFEAVVICRANGFALNIRWRLSKRAGRRMLLAAVLGRLAAGLRAPRRCCRPKVIYEDTPAMTSSGSNRRTQIPDPTEHLVRR